MGTSKTISRLIRITALTALALWAAISLGRVVQQTLSSAGGNDLYTYWYAGHFLREGKDFYKSFINNELPAVPVSYLDREVTTLDGVIFPDLSPAPATTAPVFFLMAPFAFLSWSVAKTVWLVINLALLGAIPFLIVRLFPKKKWLDQWEFLALLLALIGLTSTRYAASSGQITFLILDLMLAAILLADRKPWVSGVLLGLALSKYSLAIGILFLFVFIEPKLRIIIAAVLVQIAGIISLMLISGSGFLKIIGEYFQMAVWHAGREGVHLAAALHAEKYMILIALILTLAVGIPVALWRWKKAGRRLNQSLPLLDRYHLVVILILWVLLVGYHRAYDVMVTIVYFGLIAYLAKQPAGWDLSKKVQTILIAFTTVALLLLMVPSGSVVRGLLPPLLETIWGEIANLMATALISIFLVLSLLLLFRLRPENHQITGGNPCDGSHNSQASN